MKTVLAGIGLLSVAMSTSVSSAAIYFQEAENYDDAANVTLYDQNSGGIGGAPMSNGYYMMLDGGTGQLLFQINQGALPPGTYNIAERGYSSNSARELDLQIASGIVGISDPGFTMVGTTNNVNNAGPVWPIEWRQLYSDTTGSTLATFTMPLTGGITLRYASKINGPSHADVLAFMTAGESLPDNLVPQSGMYTPQIPVPEPASLGLLATAGLLAIRRRK